MKNKQSDSSPQKATKDTLSELESLIVRFSSRFNRTGVSDIRKEIDHALKHIVECLDIDRCAFWSLSEDGQGVIMNNYYVSPGITIREDVNAGNFPWIYEQSFIGSHVCVDRLEDLPTEAAEDKAALKALGIKSFLALPYHISGVPVAGLTFDSCTREMHCSEDFIIRIKLLGEIIVGAYYRMRMEERYRQSVLEVRQPGGQADRDHFPITRQTKNEFRFEGIVGKSPVMKNVFSRVEQVAPTDSIVLLTGETGTGKGIIARSIHELSSRKERRIVTVNCAALTPNLIESELFGREKGAYTGSTEMQIGRFELADKGTLILDEITELPLDLQAKLLRAIQDGEIERLGSPRTIKVDARIIALTSRNLKEEIARGRLRQDLYYRLNVFPIVMPPLRERKGDILLLADYFLQMFNRKMQKDIQTVPQDVMQELMTYSWPGNVRELEHVIERAVITSDGQELYLAEKLTYDGADKSDEQFVTNLADVEKNHIIKVLKQVNWRIEGTKGAAILLGLHPNTLRGRMQKLGIQIQKTVS